MSKKPDTASALAGILRAKRGEIPADDTSPAVIPSPVPEPEPTPSPAPAVPAPQLAVLPSTRVRSGKSSDKATYSQYSVYLRKDTRKKVGRALDDAETGQDFSDLVQELLDKWLKTRT